MKINKNENYKSTTNAPKTNKRCLQHNVTDEEEEKITVERAGTTVTGTMIYESNHIVNAKKLVTS